jgi:type IV secretory pathway VirJ component
MLVRGVARELAREGIPSVGLKARTYLLERRTPDAVARDVGGVLRRYLARWKAERVLLIGLSRGADILPFVVRRLSAELRARIALLALLSPAPYANFRFRWADLVGYHRRDDDVPVLPELEAIAGQVPVLCINGTRDRAALGPLLPPALAEVVMLEAGHNLGRDHRGVARLIAARIPMARATKSL